MPQKASAIRPAVAIPIYKTELSAAETLSIERSVEVLARWPVFVIGPARLSTHLDGLRQRFGQRLQVKTFEDRYFAGIKGYNRLMRSRDFYQAFAANSHLLLAQTDALVISDELESWCMRDFSYVGAPWFVGGNRPQLPLRFWGVGNGGFSLRRVDDFLRVLQTPRHIPNFVKSRARGDRGFANLVRRIKHERCLAYNVEPFFPSSNEDLFWGVLVPAACAFFRVPSPEEAIGFAFEVAPGHLYEMNANRLPFGCHAWERFEQDFWKEKLPFLASLARATT
ncbi:MAG: DUF5672 family protein [Rubrivivax sp.]